MLVNYVDFRPCCYCWWWWLRTTVRQGPQFSTANFADQFANSTAYCGKFSTYSN